LLLWLDDDDDEVVVATLTIGDGGGDGAIEEDSFLFDGDNDFANGV
jgi:hypothetical protein